MRGILVTRKDNIKSMDGEGNLELVDDTAIGYLTKIHSAVTIYEDPASKTQMQGLITRAEVYWEHQRSPAPAMEIPDDLSWLAAKDFPSEEFVDEDEEETEEVEYEDYDDVSEIQN